MDEPELKAAFVQAMDADFVLKADVPGRFLVDGSGVVIDYLLYPKPHLIERGFGPRWFGVEVKCRNGEAPKKAIRVAWQAITYSQSEFEGCRPEFVLIYPPLASFFSEPRDAYYLVCMLQKANVGYLELDTRAGKWKIKFGANTHFSSTRGLSKTPNAGLKRLVGSWK